MQHHRFPIGTKYATRGRNRQVHTVTDQLTVTNSRGAVVAVRYVAEHQFCGQTVVDRDVVDTTIARGLLPEFEHLLGTPSATLAVEASVN